MIPKESLARNDARADCDYYYSFRKTVQVLAALDFYSDTIDQSMYHDETLHFSDLRFRNSTWVGHNEEHL